MRKCLLLFVCACTLLSLTACNDRNTPREWTPVYNTHRCLSFVSRAFPIAYEERLSEDDIAEILPSKQLPFEVSSGRVDFMEDETVYHIVLYIGTESARTVLSMGPGAIYLNACCNFHDTGEKSICGSVEYTLYEADDRLMAATVINGTSMFFRTYGEVDKQDFEEILECFSWYTRGKPNLSKIKPKGH